MIRIPMQLAVATILFAGCASTEVDTRYNPRIDFSVFRTYTWVERPVARIADPRVDMSVVDYRIKRAVDRELSRKGYRRIDGGAPDLLVAYRVVLESKIFVSGHDLSLSFGIGDDWTEWQNDTEMAAHRGEIKRDVLYYDVGTLMLEFSNAKTQRLLWRGSKQARVHLDQSSIERERRVVQAVRDLLVEFPPG